MSYKLRISTQNALLILPLFLCLSLASAFLSYDATKRELMWGFEEEVAALAIVTREYVEPSWLQESSSESVFDELEGRLERLRDWGQLRRFVLFDVQGDMRMVFHGLDLQPDDHLELLRPQDGALVGEVECLAEGCLLPAFAPIWAENDGLVGWVRTDISIDSFFEALSDLRRRLAIQVGGSLLLGGLVVMFLTLIVTRKVTELRGATLDIRSGDYDRRLDAGLVREVNDLITTFNTMGSVLGETTGRARRRIVAREQFRTADDIAAAWERLVGPPRQVRGQHFECVVERGSEAPATDFGGCGKREDGTTEAVAAWVGRLRADEVQADMAQGLAASRFIEEHWVTMEPRVLLETLHRLFEIEHLQWIQVGPETGAGQGIRWVLDGQGGIHRNPLPEEGMVVLASTDPDAVRTLEWVDREGLDASGLEPLRQHLPGHRDCVSLWLRRRVGADSD